MAVRQAQQALTGLKGNLATLQASLGAVNASSAAMGVASVKASKAANTLGNRVKASGIAAMKSASQFQWFSRQLMYNWGIPLIAAGTIATKWALEVETAMTRVSKVYGSLSMDPGEKKKELEALAKYFEAVSNRYGVLQKDVIAIGADWAAAGAEAVGLAKATQLTIETMILGEMSASEATKSLIAIQEAWRVNATDLKNTIAELNIVENQTAVDMQGLIEAFVRTGSSARIAGLSTGDLAAMIAGLVPAAGNATTAGNSLKTILSRIAAPTKAAERAIGALGYNIEGTSWRSMNARERLEGMAKSFSKLDRNQKQAIATDIAGRQQYNRFVQVMDAMADKNSAYWTAQNALTEGKKKINGVTGLQIQYERELNQVLTSNPQAMKMVLARLQNLAIKGFAPLVPYIIAVLQYLVKFAQWLGGLPPQVKQLVAALLVLIVALTAFSKVIAAFRLLGPAVVILFGSLIRVVEVLGGGFKLLGLAVASPFKLLGSITGLVSTVVGTMGRSIGTVTRFAIGFINFRGALAGLGSIAGSVLGFMAKLVTHIRGLTFFSSVIPYIRQFGMTISFVFLNLSRAAMASWGMMWNAMLVKAWTGMGSILKVFSITPIFTMMRGMMGRIVQLFMGTRIVGAATSLMAAVGSVFSKSFAVISAMGFKFFWNFKSTILRTAAVQGGLVAILGRMRAGIAAAWLGIRSTVLNGMIFMVSNGGKILARLPVLMTSMFSSLRAGVGGAVVAMRSGLIRGLRSIGPAIISGLSKIIPAILVVLRGIGPLLLKLFTGPWGWAIGAVVSLIFAFRTQIWNALSGIVGFFSQMWNGVTGQTSGIAGFFSRFTQFLINCFYALPREIQNAMQAVVDVVYQAAMAVYQLFSYLNPFAHHSPSLVENVTEGMAVVAAAFGSIVNIASPIDKAYAHIKKFKDIMASFRNGRGVDLEFADDLKNIRIANPAALATAKKMIADIKVLQKALDGLGAKLSAQQKIVDAWSSKLDDANYALQRQQDILDSLSEDVDYYQSIIDDAQSSIDSFASASITGMQALDDQIQENTQSQNELRLAMAQMEQASGGFDTVADRMAALNGEFEKLTANRDELVKAGAGSDILSYYDEQIASIQNQKDSIYDTADAYTKLGQQLSDLEKKGTILDLTKSVNYDPLTYQIEKLASSQKELSYDEIVNGIKDAKSTIDQYTPALNDATAAYREQEAVVYSLTKQRDLIQRQYDAESQKLDKIKKSYDAVSDAIGDLRDALTSIAPAASKANASLSKGKKKKGSGAGVGAAGAGGYPGGGGIDAGKKSFGIKDLEKGGVGGINDLIKKMEGAMEALDLGKAIKEKWEVVVAWWVKNIQPAVDLIGRSIQDWWNKIDWTSITGNTSWLTDWWKGVTEWFGGIASSLTGIFGSDGIFGKVFGDDFQQAWDNLIQGFKDFGTEVAPGFMEFWTSIKPFIDAVGRVIGEVVKGALITLGIVLGTLLKVLLWLWNSAIQPILKGLGAVLGGLFKILGGIMDVLTGIFNFDFGMIVQGLKKIFGGVWDILVGLFNTVWGVILNLFGGLFTELGGMFGRFFPEIGRAIQGFWQWLLDMPIIGAFFKWIGSMFQWLYDFLVGHSIVPDTVNAVVGWFENMAKWLLAPIKFFINIIRAAFTVVYDFINNSPIGKALLGIVDGIKNAFSGVWEWITGPFKQAEGGVQKSLTQINDTATTAAKDTTNIFGSGSNWGDLGSTIPAPFDSAVDKSEDSFDKLLKNFKGASKDMNKSAKTDWKNIRKEINKTLDQLPKDQEDKGKKLVDKFLKTAKDIEKSNPAIWKKIQEGITKPADQAAKDVAKSMNNVKSSVGGLNGVQIPTNWKGLSKSLSNPVNSAAKSVKDDVRSMNRSIDGLDGGLPKEWKNLRSTIVDPVRDAKAALSKLHFSTSNITAPLGRIASAADRVTKALNKMISKWNQAQGSLGLKYGGSVALDKLSGYANSLNGASGMATGGSVHGPGGPTSDKVLRYLSSGEHVWTAREVSKLGGQGSVYALRSFIRRNDVSTSELIKAYRSYAGRADGGSVRYGTRDSVSASLRKTSSDTLVRNAAPSRTTNIEHATFEFPNVKNGKDAKDFLDNLEALIG